MWEVVFPDWLKSEDMQCEICMETFDTNDHAPMALQCGHTVCYEHSVFFGYQISKKTYNKKLGQKKRNIMSDRVDQLDWIFFGGRWLSGIRCQMEEPRQEKNGMLSHVFLSYQSQFWAVLILIVHVPGVVSHRTVFPCTKRKTNNHATLVIVFFWSPLLPTKSKIWFCYKHIHILTHTVWRGAGCSQPKFWLLYHPIGKVGLWSLWNLMSDQWNSTPFSQPSHPTLPL